MTKAQKENKERFKKVQAEAKKLKAKNPRLKHIDAVKQAWVIVGGKGTKTKPAAKKTGSKSISGVFKFSGVPFRDVRQFDIYGDLSYIIEDKNGKQITVIDGKTANIDKQVKALDKYINDYSDFEYYSDEAKIILSKIKKFVTQLSREARDYNTGKKRTAKEAKKFVTATLAKPVTKKKPSVKKTAVKKVVKKQTGKSSIERDRKIQAMAPGKRRSENGNFYYESRANRSDRGKLLGVNKHQDTKSHNVNIRVVSGVDKKRVWDDFKDASDRLTQYLTDIMVIKKALKDKDFIKKMGGEPYKKFLTQQLNKFAKYRDVQKKHMSQLKKLL